MTGKEFQAEVEGKLKAALEATNTPEAKKRVQTVLENWLSFTARKKSVANLELLMDEFRKRIRGLAKSVNLTYSNGKLVVIATGDSENTLRMMKRGTDWFDPAEDLDQLIAGAILGQT